MLLERERPLEALLSSERRAAAGHGITVLLEGEAGIGKTSLLQEFAGRADKDCRMLWGWCEALFTPRPLGPLQDMAQSLDPGVAALLDQAAAPERLFPALLNALQHAERHDRARLRGRALGRQRDARSCKVPWSPHLPASHDAGA